MLPQLLASLHAPIGRQPVDAASGQRDSNTSVPSTAKPNACRNAYSGANGNANGNANRDRKRDGNRQQHNAYSNTMANYQVAPHQVQAGHGN